MLIDAMADTLFSSGAISDATAKLDAGDDAALAVASSARPFIAAAGFARRRTSTLVLVPGEDAAASFARSASAYLGEGCVLHFPAREDYPFAPCLRFLPVYTPPSSSTRGRRLLMPPPAKCFHSPMLNPRLLLADMKTLVSLKGRARFACAAASSMCILAIRSSLCVWTFSAMRSTR